MKNHLLYKAITLCGSQKLLAKRMNISPAYITRVKYGSECGSKEFWNKIFDIVGTDNEDRIFTYLSIRMVYVREKLQEKEGIK